MPDLSSALNARLATESVWADRVARGWCCVKHLVVAGLALLALLGCQSLGEPSRWQVARVVEVLPAPAAAVAGPCGAVAAVKVSYYRGGTVFQTVRPSGDASLVRGQWVRFDRGTPCGAVEPSSDR